MKNTIGLILLLIVFSACAHKPKDHRAERTTETELVSRDAFFSNLVDPFYRNVSIDSLRDYATFNLVESHKIIVGSHNYTVNLYTIPNWSDPGDYLRIKLFEDDKLLLDQFNADGWVKFNENNAVPADILSKNRLKSDKLLLLDLNHKRYLFLFGWIYASEPGWMTVIQFDQQPQLIINKKFDLHAITDGSKDNAKLVGSTNFENETVIDLDTLSMTIKVAYPDKEPIQLLIRNVLNWAKSDHSIKLLPVISDSQDSLYVGFDLNKHRHNLEKLKKTGYFSTDFIENYNHIILTLDQKLRSKAYGDWMVGDLPPFEFANDVDPWTLCQDVPYDHPNPYDYVEVTVTDLDEVSGDLTWHWGNLNQKAKSSWKTFNYPFYAVKENGTWKIGHMKGFDFEKGIREEGVPPA